MRRLADKGRPTGSAPSAESSITTSTADKSHPQIHIGSSPTPSVEPSTAEVARAKLESLEKDSIPFRLLEALLKHAPTVEGVNVIITDIITASAEPNGLNQLLG